VNRAAVSGGTLAFHDVGSGPAVLLVHGFPLSSHVWRQLIPALATSNRVIAPDLLGLGGSDKPTGAALDIRAQAAYLRELLTALEIERLAVVGHSTGGGIAQLLAADPGVDTLILLDTIAFDRWPSQATIAVQVTPSAQETFETIELIVRRAFEIGMHDAALSRSDIDAYLAPWRDPEAVAAFFRWARAIDGAGLRELVPAMAAWEMPTLLLWGEEDLFHPASIAEELQEAIASSVLGLVPGCGHFLPEEAPETIFPIIAEYLRANYRKEPHGHAAEGRVLIPLEVPRDFFGFEDDDDGDVEPVVAQDQEVGPNA
jgi:pimeloyl-ACP methyl ester carboxylesterase